MKLAKFTNWTKEEFVGEWNGKKKKFPAHPAEGSSVWLPDYLAAHWSKYLTNRELQRMIDGKEVYPGGETMTSPKFPDQVPLYMELFNKAYTSSEEDEVGENQDDLDTLIAVANKNREGKVIKEQPPLNSNPSMTTPPNPNEPQIVLSPDFDTEDEVPKV